ncbi:MAG TPA: response regulator transcription factor [Thermoanaerobaculia bacterium]|nr:response regulator transcription factor [Thermoanaerobaculia bacterium]
MTRVLIVDDHPIVREGLVAALHGKGDIEVAGGFGSAEEGIAAAARLKPDVVILDLELPGLSGLEAIVKFAAPVLMLSAYGTDDEIDRALAAGAKGYLLKGAPLDEIERAIAALSRGESVTVRRLSRNARTRLTDREREVLRLLGNTNKEIAAALKISERTVKFHVTSIFNKLGADSRAQAVAIAAEQRLV